ncbi:MAG: MHYT domain-containing protein [Acidobacteriota bacterium]
MIMTAGAGETALQGTYNVPLVLVSILIAIIASFAALDLAGRITGASGRIRAAWLSSGAIAMGVGIWSMHYVGMEAFKLPVPVQYDWPTVLVSLIAAVLASGLALHIISRPRMTRAHLAFGSLMMGSGIAGMHYIGMAAMRLPATMVYIPYLVVLSVGIAVGDSYVALKLGAAFRKNIEAWNARQMWAALLMGCAIPAMHYVGMAAARFYPAQLGHADLQHAVRVSDFALSGIVVVTLVILLTAIASSMMDRALMLRDQELTRSRAHLQDIFENMAEAIIVFDSNGEIVRCNASAKKLFGASGTRSTNDFRRAFQLCLPDGAPLPEDQLPVRRAFRGEFLDNCHLRLRNTDTGDKILAEVTTRPVREVAGVVSEVMITYRDISEREQMDEIRSRLAAIVESSEDAIVGKDLQGIVTTWNRGAEKLFGYAASEILGESIRVLIPAERTHEEDDILKRLQQGETVEHFETERLRKDGRVVQVSLTISPIRDAGGTVVGASKIARDITHAKKMQRQLRQSEKMEAIGQLTGGIAHDFNNLLGIIIGNLDLLERAGGGDESLLKRVRTAQKAAVRGADLTRRLLAFSRSEDLSPRPTRVDECVRTTAELATRILGPDILMKIECDTAVPPVMVDPARLENALLNLVLNARDAMPGGGKLTVATRLSNLEAEYSAVRAGDLKPGVYACVSVSDTGTGMAAETLERAFDPFFTTKPAGKGSGLGLAMVYGFARQSRGTARIYSEIGLGTTVSIYLPLAGIELRPGPAEPPTTFMFGRSKVLVVDDEEDLLDIATAYLRDMGLMALKASHAESALELAEREADLDLVITDILMPGGMNGVQLAQRLREQSPGIKVIFSSGFPADALAERGGIAPDGPILRKPYQREEFEKMLRQILGKGAPSDA